MKLLGRIAALVFTIALTASLTAQTVTLHTTAGHARNHRLPVTPLAATSTASAALTLQILRADAHQGELWLNLQASTSADPGAHLTLRIPLSSTEDVYGESRACTINADGSYTLSFAAGMDEANFLPYAASGSQQGIHLSLNKYLCRALAAPFRCDGRELTLSQDWTRWILATGASLSLSSSAPAAVRATNISMRSAAEPFDPASCPRIAPSNGMCCVAGKSTEWHCGESPAGRGWHQVSGECFHRETGGVCDDKTIFPALE